MIPTHPEMVATLAKPGADIQREMTPDTWGVLLWSMSQFINQGKMLDRAKKVAIYNKPDEGLVGLPPRQVPPLTAEQCHLLHMAIGIAGEAAELLEPILAYCLGEPLDIENVIEESGDIEFYHEGFRQGVNFTRELALSANIRKLGVRYANFEYSDDRAQTRADKAPGE